MANILQYPVNTPAEEDFCMEDGNPIRIFIWIAASFLALACFCAAYYVGTL